MHPNDRWRCYRQRVRNGRMVPDMPDIGAAEIEFLIAMQWLAEADASDRRAVGAAIANMLADAARRR
jgi:hypothetical protein